MTRYVNDTFVTSKCSMDDIYDITYLIFIRSRICKRKSSGRLESRSVRLTGHQVKKKQAIRIVRSGKERENGKLWRASHLAAQKVKIT